MSPARTASDRLLSRVPYVKGALLMRSIEQRLGRAKFDTFLRAYFDHFAFQSITTERFVEYLFEQAPEARSLPLAVWLDKPGLPAN